MPDELPQQDTQTDWQGNQPPAPTGPPPAWDEIKAAPEFQQLNPNEQITAFQHWRGEVVNHASTLPGYDETVQQQVNEASQPEQQRLATAAQNFNIQHPDLPGLVQPPTESEGFWGTAGRAFASRIIPAAAQAYGAGVGGAVGAAAGAPEGGVGAIPGAILGAGAGGVGAGLLAENAQKSVMGDEWYNRNRQQMDLNAQAHPYAHQLGTLVPFLVSAFTGAPEVEGVKDLVGKIVGDNSPKLAKVLGGMAERTITGGVGGARAGALSEVEEKGKMDLGTIATGAGRGAVTLGAVGMLPVANTLLKQAIKGIPDSYVMATAGELYDAANEHRPVDFKKISQEGGGGVAPFVLQNALLGFLHGMPMRAKSGEAAPDESKTPSKPEIEDGLLQRQKDLEAEKAQGTITPDQQKELDDHNQVIQMVHGEAVAPEAQPQTSAAPTEGAPVTPEKMSDSQLEMAIKSGEQSVTGYNVIPGKPSAEEIFLNALKAERDRRQQPAAPTEPAPPAELPPEKQATVDQVNKGLEAGEQSLTPAEEAKQETERFRALTPEQQKIEDDEFYKKWGFRSGRLPVESETTPQTPEAATPAPTEEQRQAAEAQAKTLSTEALQQEIAKPDAGFHDIIQAELDRRANASAGGKSVSKEGVPTHQSILEEGTNLYWDRSSHNPEFKDKPANTFLDTASAKVVSKGNKNYAVPVGLQGEAARVSDLDPILEVVNNTSDRALLHSKDIQSVTPAEVQRSGDGWKIVKKGKVVYGEAKEGTAAAPEQSLEERLAAKTEAENAKAQAIKDVEEQIPPDRPFPKDVVFNTRDRELKGKQMWLEHVQDPEKDFKIQDLQKALGKDAGTEMYKQMWGEHEGTRAGRMVPLDENRNPEEVPTQAAEAEAAPEQATPELTKQAEAPTEAATTPHEQTLMDSGITDPKAFLDQVNEKMRAQGKPKLTMEHLASLQQKAPDVGGERANSGQPRSLLPKDPELIRENNDTLQKMGALDQHDPLGKSLEYLSKNGTGLQKLLSRILLGSGIDTSRVPILHDNGMDSKGVYDPLTNKIHLNLNSTHGAGGLESTLLHEALHHITVWKFNPAYKPTAYESIQLQRIERLLSQGRQAAMREILGRAPTKEELKAFELFYQVTAENDEELGKSLGLPKEVIAKLWENYNKYYGLANGKELISEASNPEFVDFMSSLPPDKSLTGRATNLYHQIKEYILNLVAGRPVSQQPALQKYLESIASIAQDAPEGKIGTFNVGLKSGEKSVGEQYHDQIMRDMHDRGKTVDQISKTYGLTPDRLQELHDTFANQFVMERAGLTPEVIKDLNPVGAGEAEQDKDLPKSKGMYADITRNAGFPYIGNFLGTHDQMSRDAQDELAKNPNAARERLDLLKTHKAGATAEDFHLFRAQLAEYRRQEVAARRAGDTAGAQAALAKANNWMQEVYDKSAEAGKALQAVQGAVDINTGDFFDLKSFYKMVYGKEFTPAQEKHVQKIVQDTTQVRIDGLKSDIKMNQEIAKNADGIVNELGEAAKGTKLTSSEKKAAAAAGVAEKTDASGKSTGQLEFGFEFNPADAGQKLGKYLNALFENKLYEPGKKNLSIRDVGNIWKFIKANYLDGTEYVRADELAKTVTADLGLKDSRIIKEAISAPKTIRQFDADRYAAQSQQRAITNAFKAWAEQTSKGKAVEWATKLWEAPRSIAVIGHVNPSLTHAGSLLFRPTRWGSELPSIVQAFRASFADSLIGKFTGDKTWSSQAYHEKLMESVMNTVDAKDGENMYAKLTNLGLAAKVGTLDDIGQYNTYLGKLGVAGNRGMDILKALRMNLGAKEYKILKGKDWFNELDQKGKDSVLKEMVTRLNSETGTTTPGTKIGNLLSGEWRTFLFAPRLEGARWQQMVVDPLRATGLYLKMGAATPAEKYFRSRVLLRSAELAGTTLAALAGNAAILNAIGSDDKINWTDPTRSDWLAFKVHGQTVLAPSSFLAPLRLSLSVLLSHVIPAENRQPYTDKIINYAMGKVTPSISDIVELTRAKQQYTGRPIEALQNLYEKAGVKFAVPRNPKDPISLYEWAATKGPIPLAATVEAWHNALVDQGASPQLSKTIIGASIGMAGSIFAVHQHPTTPLKETNP